jgi:hypothetical protein
MECIKCGHFWAAYFFWLFSTVIKGFFSWLIINDNKTCFPEDKSCTKVTYYIRLAKLKVTRFSVEQAIFLVVIHYYDGFRRRICYF